MKPATQKTKSERGFFHDVPRAFSPPIIYTSSFPPFSTVPGVLPKASGRIRCLTQLLLLGILTTLMSSSITGGITTTTPSVTINVQTAADSCPGAEVAGFTGCPLGHVSLSSSAAPAPIALLTPHTDFGGNEKRRYANSWTQRLLVYLE